MLHPRSVQEWLAECEGIWRASPWDRGLVLLPHADHRQLRWRVSLLQISLLCLVWPWVVSALQVPIRLLGFLVDRYRRAFKGLLWHTNSTLGWEGSTLELYSGGTT